MYITNIRQTGVFIMIGFIFYIFSICCSQISSEGEIEKINSTKNELLDGEDFNGYILVAKDDRILIKKGIGFANLEWEIGNQPDTKFMIASITKQFTAMLVLQLVEEGKIDLNRKIIEYLPE